MTEKERREINPTLCAEGLRCMLVKYPCFTMKEKAIMYGAISLLYNCHVDEWINKPTNEYDNFLLFKKGETE